MAIRSVRRGSAGNGGGARGKLAVALAGFALTRLMVLLGYGEHISDVHLYHEAATRAVIGAETAYADFFFPYPPLALPLVYLPVLFAQSFPAYRFAFRVEMLLFDLLCLALLVRLVRRLGRPEGELRLAVYAYALLGLAVGHLLYDRLDLVVAAALTALLLGIPATGRGRWASRAVVWAGALVKLVPLLLAPLVWLGGVLSGPRWRGRAGWSRPAGEAALLLLPVAAVLVAWNLAVGGALFGYLGEHGARGIEIESVWATPVWVVQRLVRGAAVPIDHRFGGQHLGAEVAPALWVALSKIAGALLLAAYLALLGRRWWRRSAAAGGAPDREAWFLGGLAAIVLFLATQRILSPQYLLWVMPGLAILAARQRFLWALPLTLLVYALTWEGFRRGYWLFVEGDPWFVAVYALRNLALVALAAGLVRAALRAASDPPQ